MKQINLIISDCKACPHFSRVSGVNSIPSCCYAKATQLPKVLPYHFKERDDFTGHNIYEVDPVIPKWCPLEDVKKD